MKDYRKRMALRILNDLHARLTRAAGRAGMSNTDTIVMAAGESPDTQEAHAAG